MSDTQGENKLIAFGIHLTVYSPQPVLASGKKSQAKPKASTKSKELEFAIAADNYALFLQAVLDCCSLQKCRATARWPYPFKYTFASPKLYVISVLLQTSSGCNTTYRKSVTPLDIENQAEYNGMVQAIQKGGPQKVTILVDSNEIKAKCCVGADEDVDSDDSGNDGVEEMGKYKNATDLDLQCVKWRKELMHVHNKVKGEFWYCPTNDPKDNIKITPAQCRTWCLAIITTIDHPPNSDEFDPEKRKAALHPDRQTPSTPTAGDQFTPFAHAITSVTSLAVVMLGHTTPILPETPTHPRTQHLPIELGSSPPAPRLPCVCNALGFEDKMAEHSYGPDILHEVPKADLTALGIPARDVIQLQNEVRGRDDRRVQYEVIFAAGGGNCFTAGPLESGNPRPNGDVFNYFNEALGEMVPIPPGYRAPAQSVEEEMASEAGWE
ncbi:hypothetical protein JAAARDRAFT_200391 [Jaapia argillacea MUCL 33604]|uniref:Uncharacterized protein n=1 Tax=Jaapia argillacea MUCL 33604 TaxID=933084 RepID=A0A067P5E2_9AGAM|nr:hypothetical protein JAAARDRAFT_200391 [Jaapia argillacea MUCL 33604]